MDKKKPIIVISCIILFLVIIFSMIGSKNTVVVNAVNSTANVDVGKPNLNVFLENSGSMDGYMNPGSQLKDAIYSYVSDLSPECDTVSLYYINSQIVKRPDDLYSYIMNLNPTSFAKAGGNRSNSDLGNVIKNVLANTPNNTVSLLISDFILDLPSKDANKFLALMSIQIKNEINAKFKDDPDFGVVILRMESLFKGKYFYPNGSVENIDGARPYYIWMFGNKNYLAKLKQEVPFSKIKHGYKDYVAYTNYTPTTFEVSNLSMTNNAIASRNGKYDIMVRADFAPTLQPENAITSISNYKTRNSATAINNINPITASGEKYTHYLLLSLDSTTPLGQEDISFIPPKMPKWIDDVNDETATNILDNMDKTTGIKSLIEGVADAYDKYNIATDFKLNINKNRR